MPINDRAKCNRAIRADLLMQFEGKVQEHSRFLIFSPFSHHDAAADGFAGTSLHSGWSRKHGRTFSHEPGIKSKKPTPSPLFRWPFALAILRARRRGKTEMVGAQGLHVRADATVVIQFYSLTPSGALFLNNPEAPGGRAGCCPEPICRERESRKLWSPGCAGKAPSASSA